MKKIFFFLIYNCIQLSACMETNNEISLKCTNNIKSIEQRVKEKYYADSVVICIKSLREEIYLPSSRCLVVNIYNATTNTLDFKKLPIDEYKSFNDFQNIEDALKTEGGEIAKLFINNCDLSCIDGFIIEFKKKDNKGGDMYRFICHYDEMMK
jgi:hypothetical protein